MMSNCGIHDNYYGAMGHCPSCRIADLQAKLYAAYELGQEDAASWGIAYKDKEQVLAALLTKEE